MYTDWRFFRSLIENVQLDLAKADMGIAELYAGLVKDAGLRADIFGRIHEEHDRSAKMVNLIVGQKELLERAPLMKRSIERRNPYVDPLNLIQVTALAHLRTQEPSSEDWHQSLQVVLNTINAIAGGMKTTG
jgi:phosphoenolpyruvate carboxylase